MNKREPTCATHARYREGLSIFPRELPSDQTVERQFRNRPLQTLVLAFKILEAFRLGELQSAVLTAPAIVTLVQDPKTSTHGCDRSCAYTTPIECRRSFCSNLIGCKSIAKIQNFVIACRIIVVSADDLIGNMVQVRTA